MAESAKFLCHFHFVAKPILSIFMAENAHSIIVVENVERVSTNTITL